MRRVHSILAILALLAVPWALLARSYAAGMDGCDGYCCLPHGAHAHHSQKHPSAVAQSNAGMECHHGDAGRSLDCSMRSGHHNPDYGLLAPLVSTSPSAIERISGPGASRHSLFATSPDAVAGFLAPAFEPPRA
jgi:hypothetical protein